jgi:DNA-binding NtrC family response regulator
MSQHDSILVLDTEESIRSLLQEYFTRLGHVVHQAASVSRALEIIAASRVRVIVLDIGIAGGFDLVNLDRLRQAQTDLRFILLTGYPTLDMAVEAIRHGAFDFIIKPFRLEDLRGSVQRAMTTPSAPRIQPLRDRIAILEDALRRHGITPPVSTDSGSAGTAENEEDRSRTVDKVST